MGDLDFKLDRIVQIFDLIKRMTLGAIPLWFALTLPVIYIVYKKLLPEPNLAPAAAPTFIQRIRNWFAMPQLDSIVIYTSLALFIIGTITLYIDQRYRENVRNNGLRMKEYLVNENFYSFSKDSFSKRMPKLSVHKINDVLDQYPTEFIETENRFIVLMDSFTLNKIINTSEKLLDTYLCAIKTDSAISINRLFKPPYFFTRKVVYKLIADSTPKYQYNILTDGEQVIIRKK